MKSALFWLLRTVVFRIPSVRRILTDLVISVEGGLSVVEVLARAITQAIPGTLDDRIAAELAEGPASGWLRTRGARLTLPTGRTLLEEYEAVREAIRGD